MFKPTRSMRVSLLLGATVLTWLAPASAHAQSVSGKAVKPGSSEPPPYEYVLPAEALSRTVCERSPDRVFVRHRLGTECIAYFVTSGRQTQRQAVIYLHGDIPREQSSAEEQAKTILDHRRGLQKFAEAYEGLPFVWIARPGILGSSGNHGERRRPKEVMSINAAIDAIKQRMNLDRVVLVGQSGGSMVAASMMTLGRTDVSCAVLGSGNLMVVDWLIGMSAKSGKRLSRDELQRRVYDPSLNTSGIAADHGRRIFVIGDPEDQRTPFPMQQGFASLVEARGHHVKVVPIKGAGPERHGSSYLALPAAAQCARRMPDDAITASLQSRAPALIGREATARSAETASEHTAPPSPR